MKTVGLQRIPIHVKSLSARELLDSRGFPTIEVTLRLQDGSAAVASTPAGASTGEGEAQELRDGGTAFGGRGVHRALSALRDEIAPMITGRDWDGIGAVDAALATLDGTERYARLGANSVVAVSMACARAFAHRARQEPFEWVAAQLGTAPRLPVPHFNVINGGAHASNDLAFQEFMIAPVGATDEMDAVRTGAEIYHALGARLRAEFGAVGVGDEGGFAPPLDDERQALDILLAAIADAGFPQDGGAVTLALDPAANGFYQDGRYRLRGKWLDRDELARHYTALVDSYPIRSIEDGFSEWDEQGWQILNSAVGDRVQLVGDDIYVTDAQRIRHGGEVGCSNAALIKPNQIGTVSQTLEAISTAYQAGMQCMVSHRSGETLDTFIADLAVGAGTGQIKSGAPARGERVAKYNRLTQIAAGSDLPYGLT